MRLYRVCLLMTGVSRTVAALRERILGETSARALGRLGSLCLAVARRVGVDRCRHRGGFTHIGLLGPKHAASVSDGRTESDRRANDHEYRREPHELESRGAKHVPALPTRIDRLCIGRGWWAAPQPYTRPRTSARRAGAVVRMPDVRPWMLNVGQTSTANRPTVQETSWFRRLVPHVERNQQEPRWGRWTLRDAG